MPPVAVETVNAVPATDTTRHQSHGHDLTDAPNGLSSSSSGVSSGDHTPRETAGVSVVGEGTMRPTTPTNAATTSSSAQPSPKQVEGKPAPPPGLSPVHQQQKQQFTYNGRQVQVVSSTTGNIHSHPSIPPSGLLHPSNLTPQQQMAVAAQQYQQLQLAAYQQQLLQQQQAIAAAAQGARPTRNERRPPHPNATRQYANPYGFANGAGPSGPGPLYPPPGVMSYEMYQQMLFASGTIDANLFAAAVASGQVFQMYQAMVAQTAAAGGFYPPAMQAEYALQLAAANQQPYYGADAQANLAAAGVNTGSYRNKSMAQGAPAGLLPSPQAYAEFAAQQAAAASGGFPQQQFGYNGTPAQLPDPSMSSPSQLRSSGGGRRGNPSHSHQAATSSSEEMPVEGYDSSMGMPSQSPQPGAGHKSPPQPSTYKTEICRSHQATGSCEYGASCQFSHGAHELRSREVDSKYKTELCRNFHGLGGAVPGAVNQPQQGSCWYGNRCRFLHDEFRLRQSANEFWLVAPSDNLIRVERVAPSAGAETRLEQLAELMQSEHNRKQTLLFAASIGCVSPTGELNSTTFQSHMQQMMAAQLQTQGEAQIHVREGGLDERVEGTGSSRSQRRKQDASIIDRDQVLQNQQHQHLLAVAQVAAVAHQAQQIQAAAAAQAAQTQVQVQQHHQQQTHHHQSEGETAITNPAPVATAAPARTGSDKRGIVVVTPILPLNSVHSNGSASNLPVISNAAVRDGPTPVTQPQPQVNQPMSYARKVATAPPPPPPATALPLVAKVAPAPVASAASLSKSNLASTSGVANHSKLPTTHTAPADQWQTKVSGKRGNKYSPSKEANTAPEGHQDADHKAPSSNSVAGTEDEEDLTHIIAKISEIEMKAAERKQQGTEMD